MSKRLVLFDFDGTLTTRDTLLEIGKFHAGKLRFLLNMALLLPWLVALKTGLIVNWKVKQRYLGLFFGGMDAQQFEQRCKDFAQEVLPDLIRPKALAKIKELQKGTDHLYIVSASAIDWIEPWASQHNIPVIGTELERKNGVITGKLNGNNCYGPEKVVKIKAKIDMKNYEVIQAYGDSSGDREMFTLATETFYKPFRN